MVAGIIMSLIGILFIFLGLLIWKKEMISLFHSYHYDKVSDENKSSFCRLSGIGILIMGFAILISGVLAAITNSTYSFIILAIGFIIGICMLCMATAKYNK